MKKLILMLIIISATATFSQWQKIESPKGNIEVLGYLEYNGQFYVINSNMEIVIYDKEHNSIYIESNLYELVEEHRQHSFVMINEFVVENDIFFICTTSGLFFSNNMGKTWQYIEGLDNNPIEDIKYINSQYYAFDSFSLYISTDLNTWEEPIEERVSFISNSNSEIYGVLNGNFVKFHDNELSFDILYNLVDSFELQFVPKGKMFIDKKNIVIADRHQGLFISIDGGNSWHDYYLQYPEDVILIGDTTIVLSKQGTYYSFDNMSTWNLSENFNAYRPKNLIISNDSLFMISYNGFHVSDDFGITWDNFDMSISDIPVYHINQNDSLFYVCALYNYIYTSNSNIINWSRIQGDAKNETIAANKINFYKDVIFAFYGTYSHRSTDKGETWNSIELRNVIDFENYKDTLFVGKRNLFPSYSTDNGKSWTDIIDTSDLKKTSFEEFHILNDRLYATNSYYGHLYKYVNSGNNWEVYAEIELKEVSNFTSYKDDLILTQNNEVYKYDTKNDILKLLSTVGSNIRYIVNHGPNFFIITYENGIMLSKDTCNTWIKINDGIKDVYSNGIAKGLLIFDNYIYAATSKGIYKANLEDFNLTSVEHTETQNYLYTYPPYPQPASTEVRSLVYWDTSLEMNTESVKIYNINGTEVSREQDISFEQINAYSGNLSWNCTNVPDGVYLIQISHGDRTQTIKVMVRK